MARRQPPFVIPNHLKAKTGLLWVERKIPDYSDGDRCTWPDNRYRPASEEHYLCHLGQKWAEIDGLNQPGETYYIDKLPDGYAMFEIDQPNGKQVYKRLFGHPSKRFYDSAMKYEVHFLWLISGMDGDCECTLCGSRSTTKPLIPRIRRPRDTIDLSLIHGSRDPSDGLEDELDSDRSASMSGIAARRALRLVRQAGTPQVHAQDEEGTEDIYKECVKRLEQSQGSKTGIEIDLSEENSIDWRAEREILPQYLTQIERQHAFVPRIGELVLWYPNPIIGHYLMLDPTTSEYRFYSFEDKVFRGFPAWRGGVIASVPSATTKNGPVDFTDLLDTPSKKTSFNTAGFRVETMPDPNNDVDKSLSKQYRYVPLKNIRPLSQWQIVLHGLSPKRLHPSITYALTCMTSISLLEKWRFNGQWPSGSIYCKGLYLGSELITVGDAVRVLGSSEDEDDRLACRDVLVVTSIRYVLDKIQPEHATTTSAQLSTESRITLVGQGYTTDAHRAYNSKFSDDASTPIIANQSALKQEVVKTVFRAVGAGEYGPWYPLHGPAQKMEVSQDCVLGRLYEADAVRLWAGQRQEKQKLTPKPSLELDVDSIIAGRRYATATDDRLAEPQTSTEISWFLGDTRAQSLAIATLNGVEVGRYHRARDAATAKEWRRQVKVAEGKDTASESLKDNMVRSDLAIGGSRRGRPPGSKVIDGKLVLAGDYDSNAEEDEDAKIDVKPSSQMVGAGLAFDSEGGEDSWDDEGSELDHTKPSSSKMVMPPDDMVVYPTSTPRRTAMSKQEIMAKSIEKADSISYDDDDSDSDVDDDVEDIMEWAHQGQVHVRGGTEESSGGDYHEG